MCLLKKKLFTGYYVFSDGMSLRIGLNVEVTEHFVRAPTADEMNLIGVNIGAKEGHGITG